MTFIAARCLYPMETSLFHTAVSSRGMRWIGEPRQLERVTDQFGRPEEEEEEKEEEEDR